MKSRAPTLARVRTRLSAFVPVLALLLLIAAGAPGRPAAAATTDCIENAADGQAICSAPLPTPLTYALCEEINTVNRGFIDAAWCAAYGGT